MGSERLREWLPWLALATLGLALASLALYQLGRAGDAGQPATADGWEQVVVDLIESNARLRNEVAALEAQLEELADVEGAGLLLELMVDETNRLRIANGLVAVSGPGVEVLVTGPISVPDLYDLINELRNAGAEALALNGHRLVAGSAVGNDGAGLTVDGYQLQPPYRLVGIGDADTLRGALTRPGGLVSLLEKAREGISVRVSVRERLTLPVIPQPSGFGYAEAVRRP